MTHQITYTPEQALARDLLLTAANGGINHWAHIHGYRIDAAPEQVRAEGIDLHDRSVWTVDLADITRAVNKLIATPYRCAAPASGIDLGLLGTVGSGLADARRHWQIRVADIKPSPAAAPAYDRADFERMVADVVFQVAVADEVTH